MKRIILGFIFVLLSITIIAQNFGKREIYKDYGTWNIEVENDEISISAFVTIQRNIESVEPYALKIEAYSKSKKEIKKIEEYKITYRYELYLKSNSTLNGDTTSTWIYGARVFIDDREVTREKFPKGFMISIAPKPTLVYWYEANEKRDLDFYIKWESAVYENRINNQNN